MRKRASLSEYVKIRNGVPLGAKHSLRNMLHRSFGAGSFAKFWNYWNPIWSFYLSKFVMRPTSAVVPIWFAIFLTFVISGLLHDLAISAFYQEIYLFFTPWFGFMSLVVVLTEKFNISYNRYPWVVRALVNSFLIASSFSIVKVTIAF
jgi:hypothetical protein